MEMETKNISVNRKVYDILISEKGERESFSDVIERLVKGERKSLKKFFGALKERKSLLNELEDSSKRIRKATEVRIKE